MPAAEQTNDKLVKLAKPYKFDDEEYSEINLSGLDKLTIEDAVLTVKKLTGDGELAAMVMPETSTAYTDELAAKATDLPIEFFKLLPIGASKKVRQMVQGAITVPAQKDESAPTFCTSTSPISTRAKHTPKLTSPAWAALRA